MYQLHTYSNVGGHRVNEDAFVAHRHPADPDCWLVVLADGQGGRAGGAAAANLACQSATTLAAEYTPAQLSDSTVWQDILTRTDAVVAADPSAGFTTVVGLCVRGDRLAGASCGDSAALMIGNETSNELTARQFKNPPVGSGEATFIPFEAELVRPWRLLVMSDGVWKYAGWDKIKAAAARTGGAALLTVLQDAAHLRGSGAFPDDFTVVLIEAPA